MKYKETMVIVKRHRRNFYRHECNERLEFLIAMARNDPSEHNIRELVFYGYVQGKEIGIKEGINKGLQWSIDHIRIDKKEWEL